MPLAVPAGISRLGLRQGQAGFAGRWGLAAWESCWKEHFLAASGMFWINHLGCQKAESSGLGFGCSAAWGHPKGWFPQGVPSRCGSFVASLLTLEQRWVAQGNPWHPLAWGCSSDGAGQEAGAGPGHCRGCEPSVPSRVPLESGWCLAPCMEDCVGLP